MNVYEQFSLLNSTCSNHRLYKLTNLHLLTIFFIRLLPLLLPIFLLFFFVAFDCWIYCLNTTQQMIHHLNTYRYFTFHTNHSPPLKHHYTTNHSHHYHNHNSHYNTPLTHCHTHHMHHHTHQLHLCSVECAETVG